MNTSLTNLYQKSIEGDSEAQNNLAFCYENGKGVKIDLKKAIHLYQKSAEAGNYNAQYNLAICYKTAKESASIYKRPFIGIKSLLKLVIIMRNTILQFATKMVKESASI